jgi:hypothetical protein
MSEELEMFGNLSIFAHLGNKWLKSRYDRNWVSSAVPGSDGGVPVLQPDAVPDVQLLRWSA